MKKSTKQLPTYPGPSRADVERLPDSQVDAELAKLNVTPWEFPCDPDDDEAMVAHFSNKPHDHVWTPAELLALRLNTHQWHRRCLRDQLHTALVMAWVGTLSDSVCWKIIKAAEGCKITLSEQRYTPREKLHERTTWAVTALAHQPPKETPHDDDDSDDE